MKIFPEIRHGRPAARQFRLTVPCPAVPWPTLTAKGDGTAPSSPSGKVRQSAYHSCPSMSVALANMDANFIRDKGMPAAGDKDAPLSPPRGPRAAKAPAGPEHQRPQEKLPFACRRLEIIPAVIIDIAQHLKAETASSSGPKREPRGNTHAESQVHYDGGLPSERTQRWIEASLRPESCSSAHDSGAPWTKSETHPFR